MRLITGSSTAATWDPDMASNTSVSSYWLNWRFFVCAAWVFLLMGVSLFLIWKKENYGQAEARMGGDDETWRPCLSSVHPAWLLAFRFSAFFVFFVLLIVAVSNDGCHVFYFYTQWTFTLVTIYFGLGSMLSIHGCYKNQKIFEGKVENADMETEEGVAATPASDRGSHIGMIKRSNPERKIGGAQLSSKLAFAFHIIFQINAGSVMLTDCVFWFVFLPFLLVRDYDLDALTIIMHTINAIFLLGDTALNSLEWFPLFRIAYFFLWTITYVLFLWIIHAIVPLWWPYPFLDLSSPNAPLWYICAGVIHMACFFGFSCIIKLKGMLFSRWFPESYRLPSTAASGLRKMMAASQNYQTKPNYKSAAAAATTVNVCMLR